MTRRLLLLLPAAATLFACVSAPERRDVDIGVAPPERWSAEAESSPDAVDGAWWRSLGDPGLAELITIALEQNRDLRAAAARVDRAAAEARIAGADLEPSIGVGLAASRQRQSFIGFPIPSSAGGVPSTTTTRYGVSLDSSWEVDLWGRLKAGARAAVADLQSTEAELRGARLSLAAQVARVWFAIVEADLQVTLARDTAARRRESAELVRARYEQGIRPALDLRLALSTLATAEALVELRQEQLDRSTRQLAVLLGRYPDLGIRRRIGGDLAPPSADVPIGLPAEMVARRPDVYAAERRLAAADQRWVAAKRSLYPRLTLTGSGGTVTEELKDLLDGDFRVWSIVANLTQPLFQGGRLRAAVDRADAGSREALERYAETVLRAYAEVESALAAESYLAARERHLAESASQLSAAERLAGDRYRRGVGPYLELLESESRALVARSELLSVRRQRWDNRIGLHVALGGGFETDSTEETP